MHTNSKPDIPPENHLGIRTTCAARSCYTLPVTCFKCFHWDWSHPTMWQYLKIHWMFEFDQLFFKRLFQTDTVKSKSTLVSFWITRFEEKYNGTSLWKEPSQHCVFYHNHWMSGTSSANECNNRPAIFITKTFPFHHMMMEWNASWNGIKTLS